METRAAAAKGVAPPPKEIPFGWFFERKLYPQQTVRQLVCPREQGAPPGMVSLDADLPWVAPWYYDHLANLHVFQDFEVDDISCFCPGQMPANRFASRMSASLWSAFMCCMMSLLCSNSGSD
jgi:hypothetical protein